MSVCLGEQHLHSLDAWVDDLRAAVKHVAAHPGMKLSGAAAVYGAASTAPDEVLDEILRGYVDIKLSVEAK